MNHVSMVYKNKEQVKEMGDQGMKIKDRGGASIMISNYHAIRISNKWPLVNTGVCLVVWRVKDLPAMQENWVQPLGWEDALEKGKAVHSSIPAWVIPWTEVPGGLQSVGSKRVRQDWMTDTSTFTCQYWNLKFWISSFSSFPLLLLDLIFLSNFPAVSVDFSL